jgi:hypothetical protein
MGYGVLSAASSVGRHALAVAAALLLPVAATGQTQVSGNITENTVWTVGGSPYVIENSTVEVKNGSTLVIEPGVEVRFKVMSPKAQLRTEVGSSIVAVGTQADSIFFTSDASVPLAGDWGMVGVFGSTESGFAYCSFRYGYQALYYSGSKNPVDPDISRSSFDKCVIGIYLVSCSPSVSECWLRESSYNVLSRGPNSEPTFWHCNFLPAPAGWNIYLQSYVGPEVVNAEFCWWGSDDETSIAATIKDGNDPGALGTVDFDPWLHQTPVEATSWGVIKALFR